MKANSIARFNHQISAISLCSPSLCTSKRYGVFILFEENTFKQSVLLGDCNSDQTTRYGHVIHLLKADVQSHSTCQRSRINTYLNLHTTYTH